MVGRRLFGSMWTTTGCVLSTATVPSSPCNEKNFSGKIMSPLFQLATHVAASSIIRTCGTLEGSLVVSWPLWGFAWILQWVLTMCRVQGPIPLVAARLAQFLQPCLVLGVVPTLCGALLCPSKTERRLSRHQLKLFKHLVYNRIGPLICSQLDVCQGGGVVSSLLDVFHHEDLLSYSLFLWTSRKRLTQHGLRALWSSFMRW